MPNGEVGEYDHLNEKDPICLPLDLDMLADLIVKSNYGMHRMLSALIRARKRSSKKPADDKLMKTIERLLKEGEI